MAKIIAGIYRITNIINGKFYIGSSINIDCRWKAHVYNLTKGTHTNSHLQAAWDEHGESSFKFEIIEELPQEMLLEAEQWYLTNTYCCDSAFGYNMAKFVESGMKGRKHSDRTKNAMSFTRRGRKLSNEHKANIGLGGIGRKHSVETLKKMVDKWTERGPVSKVARDKMSISHCKLSDCLVNFIRSMCGFVSATGVADVMSINKGTVIDIWNGRTYHWVK